MKDDDLPEVFRDMAPWQRFWLLRFPVVAYYVACAMFLCCVIAMGVTELVKYLLGS